MVVPPRLPGSHDWIESWICIYIYSFSTCVCSFKCFMLSFIFGFVPMQACLCVGPLMEEAIATAAVVVCHCCLVNYRWALPLYIPKSLLPSPSHSSPAFPSPNLQKKNPSYVWCNVEVVLNMRTRYCDCNMVLIVAFRFVSFMLEAMLSTGYLLFIFSKII